MMIATVVVAPGKERTELMQLLFAHKMKLLLKTLHTFASCAWVGGVSAVLIILNNDRQTINGNELFALNCAITTIDDMLIGPGATLSLLTGALLCLTSKWGFFRHFWVVVKWIGTLVAIYVGVAYLNPWMKKLAHFSDIYRDDTAQNIDYLQLFHKGTIAVSMQIGALFLLVIVSIFKPDMTSLPSEYGLQLGILRGKLKKAVHLRTRITNKLLKNPGCSKIVGATPHKGAFEDGGEMAVFQQPPKRKSVALATIPKQLHTLPPDDYRR
jgi:hypothetical protein